MNISKDQARGFAFSQLKGFHMKPETLIVTRDGDVYANCDIDQTCKILESKGETEEETFYILEGSRKTKVKSKEPNEQA